MKNSFFIYRLQLNTITSAQMHSFNKKPSESITQLLLRDRNVEEKSRAWASEKASLKQHQDPGGDDDDQFYIKKK